MSCVKTPVGLIGLGLVGSALAERLLAAGQRVVGWDIDPGRMAALRANGGDVAGNVHEVFSSCRRVLLSLPSHREVADVIDAAGASLNRGLTIIDTTTGDPASTEALARSLADRGIIYLDATISGSSAQVRAGSVTLMVGGDAESFAASADIFESIGRQTFHTGPAGTRREDEAGDQSRARPESGRAGRRSGFRRVVGSRPDVVARGDAGQRRVFEDDGHQGRAHDSWRLRARRAIVAAPQRRAPDRRHRPDRRGCRCP